MIKSIFEKWKSLSLQELRWMIEAIINRRVEGKKTIIDLESTINTFSDKERIRLNAWIKDRIISHKPLQYILRSQPFCGLDLSIRSPTLIPRWETEEWTLKVIDILKSYIQQYSPKEIRVLDLCSGSGCISLAIAHHLLNISTKLQVIGIDNSLSAIALASVNQRKLGISSDNCTFIHADIFKQLPISGQFDFIVSNPPYISFSQQQYLDRDVLDWEDHSALFAEQDGLIFYKRIFDLLPLLLSRHSISSIVVEVDGENQAKFVKNLALNAKYCEIWKDFAKNTRSVYCNYNQK